MTNAAESEPASSATSSRARWIWWAKTVFRLLVIGLVLAGIGHTIRKSLAQFEQHRFSLSELKPGWLVAAGVLYLLGSLPGWWFWHRVLQAMGQRPDPWASLRAFFIGHLGKYVPGKAMVVVLRAGLVRSLHVDTAVAATAVFVETLTTMAVGAVVGAFLVFLNYRDQPLLLGLAVVLLIGAGVPAWPPVFRRVVLLLRVQKTSPQIEPALQALRFPLMASGWLLIGASWFLLGMSLWATMMAMPDAPPALMSFTKSLPLMTACVTLAMVAGFVSMLPGGVGVREFVVMTLLAPPFGEVAAVVSAILLRFVWLLAELVVSAILYFVRSRNGAAPVAESTLTTGSSPPRP